MSKILALMTASLLAGGAYAQNPPGTSSQQQVITDSIPQQRAQATVDARLHGVVNRPLGDRAKSPLNYPFATGKPARVAEAHVDVREAMYPNRDPARYPGTPGAPGWTVSR